MSTDNNDPLSADYSPGVLDDKVGVRRVNAKPLMILGLGLGVFLIIIAMVAYDRSAKSQKTVAVRSEKKPAATTATFAKAAMGDASESGLIAAADPNDNLTAPPDLPPGDTVTMTAGRPLRSTPGDLPYTAVPPIRPMNGEPKLHDPGHLHHSGPSAGESGSGGLYRAERAEEPDKDAERLREIKFKQFEEAMRGSTAVAWNPRTKPSQIIASPSKPAPALGQSSREADLARLAELESRISNSESEEAQAKTFQERITEIRGHGNTTASGDNIVNTTSRNDLSKFDGKAGRWNLDTQDEAPAKYQLTTGHIIPAILITAINSELAGEIIGQVSQDVYDTATGKQLLIPRGTKVYGAYESDIVYGQASVMVAIQRLIYPDGKTRDIGSMRAADAAGRSGMRDQVNNHYARIFGSSFLMSGITAGVALSQPSQTSVSQAPTARTALSEALGQQLGQTSSQLLSKNLNISPTLEIRPGYRFNIIVVKDLIFKTPYKSFDYVRASNEKN